MTDRQPTTLPTPAEDAALAASLGPLFDQTASQPSAEAIARLTAHASTLPARPRGLAPLQALALAAVALLAVVAGQWTPAWTVDRATQFAAYGTVDEASWLDDELAGGFDLLGLSTDTDDPEGALEAVNALIAELDDDA
jgi:hypothetical protein